MMTKKSEGRSENLGNINGILLYKRFDQEAERRGKGRRGHTNTIEHGGDVVESCSATCGLYYTSYLCSKWVAMMRHHLLCFAGLMTCIISMSPNICRPCAPFSSSSRGNRWDVPIPTFTIQLSSMSPFLIIIIIIIIIMTFYPMKIKLN